MAIETCPSCGRVFWFEIGKPEFPAYDDREPVNCPHCDKEVRTVRTRGTAKTRPLTPDEENRPQKLTP